MIKTRTDDQVWLVQQHHHAQISGFLAAHWGGVNGFARPGHFPGATDPVAWREEVILGIAEHDNGWWEWEAMPQISDQDGLPVGVSEAAPPTVENELSAWSSGGFDRWRMGTRRLEEKHPYAALLVSQHAFWLYAVAFDDWNAQPANRHFVFGAPDVAQGMIADIDMTRRFLEEQSEVQRRLKDRLLQDPIMAAAIEPQHLGPHVRLLQLLDSMSLHLSLNDGRDHELKEVPRGSLDDTVTLTWKRRDSRTIVLDPFPFALDPLPVHLPVRSVSDEAESESSPRQGPMATLHGTPLKTVELRIVSP